MTVWFNSKYISNVLSCALLTESGQVVADYASHDVYFYCVDGEIWMEFVKFGCELYAYDVSNHENPNENNFLSFSLL